MRFFEEGWRKERYWFYISIAILFVIVILGVYIRTTNIPQLKDITTGEYTLGPDLDPFLYLRLAHNIIETGSLPIPDYTRYLGLGGEYKNFISFEIAYLYKFLSLFSSSISLEYAAIIFPVIAFGLSIITFFFFVRELFYKKPEFEKSAISVLSSLLYAVIPAMQHRTTAGIPELESAGMIFFWLTFFFFLRAWNSEGKILNISEKYLYGLLSGLSTIIMVFQWGGYRFIFLGISITTLIFFLMGKVSKDNTIVYTIWFLLAEFGIIMYQNLYLAVFDITTSTPALFVFVLLWTNIFFGKYLETKLKNIFRISFINDRFATIFAVIVLGFFFLLLLKPDFALSLFSSIIERLLHPYGEARVGLTVAENIQPYTIDLINQFGKGFFWMIIFGTILLFYETIKNFGAKNIIILTSAFSIFLIGFIFSRYSSTSIFNGQTFVSQLFYFGTMLLFLFCIIYIYLKNSKSEQKINLEEMDYNYIFILSLTILMILASKGAIRLLFISSPVFTILVAFFVISLFSYLLNQKDEFWKVSFFVIMLISLFFFSLSFINFEKQTSYSVKFGEVPSYYTFQWQNAMSWVRENTPKDSIFVHWWDYGYWVQSIGKRATVTDGGHLIGYWDHLTGRYLLTTPKPETALSLMKSYNVSYLLIDSTDFGKYSAYSKIGSDKDGQDRFGIIQIMINNPSQSIINKTEITKIYQGGLPVDEDIVYNDTNLFLPSEKAFVGGIILKINQSEKNLDFSQPLVAYVYNQRQYNIPARYVYYKGKIIDFKSGIDATIVIIPLINQGNNQQINIDFLGAAIYLSPKISKSLFAQLYLLDDVFNNYPTINLAHSEDSSILSNLKAQGAELGEFAYYQGFQGPIKIWKVDYSPNIIRHDEFLKTEGEYAELDNLTFAT